ncbi:30S ribosomal protein S6 [Candidatus Curtissbacteria bacterium]|nr:30S ribosomal protein S6 [Candidatus Curtissbacteria bacterium]
MYQLMVIARGTEGADSLVSKVEKHFKELSIAAPKLERLGKKTLAYPIAKQTEAEYLLYTLEADGATINQLNGRLRLEQELVLRFLITNYDPNKVTKAPVVSPVASPEAKVEEKARPKVTVTTKIRETKKETEEPKATKVKAPAAKAKGKVKK